MLRCGPLFHIALNSTNVCNIKQKKEISMWCVKFFFFFFFISEMFLRSTSLPLLRCPNSVILSWTLSCGKRNHGLQSFPESKTTENRIQPTRGDAVESIERIVMMYLVVLLGENYVGFLQKSDPKRKFRRVRPFMKLFFFSMQIFDWFWNFSKKKKNWNLASCAFFATWLV